MPEFDRDAAASRFLPAVQKFARRMAARDRRHTDDAEGAAVEALAKAVLGFDPAKGSDFECYLWPAVARAVRRELARCRRRVRTVALSEAVPATSPVRRELHPDTRRRLPPDLLRAVELYSVEGRSLRGCAAELGLSVEGVRRRLRAAAERIRFGSG